MIQVVESMCPQNHPCPVVNVCPLGAITQQGFRAPEVDNEVCTECGLCTRYCMAFRMVETPIDA